MTAARLALTGRVSAARARRRSAGPRTLWLVMACLATVAVGRIDPITAIVAARTPSNPSVRLLDVDNRTLDPFLAGEQSRAIVFLFASVDCPISNRYAPVVQRLHDTFAKQGVTFWLIYPNPAETPEAIREHVKAFNYPVHALRDPKHELVKLAGVTVTPETAVYDHDRVLVYRGRIDDRYVSLGIERPAATQNDLADALSSTIASRPVRQATTPAVGCFISDFVQ